MPVVTIPLIVCTMHKSVYETRQQVVNYTERQRVSPVLQMASRQQAESIAEIHDLSPSVCQLHWCPPATPFLLVHAF